MSDQPPQSGPPASGPGSRGLGTNRGTGAAGETVVRITSDDLVRRAALERMRVRLLCVAGGFGVLFGAIGVKLTLATVLRPMAPAARQIAPLVPRLPHADPHSLDPGNMLADDLSLVHVHRASIVDRNGRPLAISLPMATVFANPLEMIDPADVARRLKAVLPQIDSAEIARRLSEKKQFVYIARDVTPDKELAINDLGIPGIYFAPGEKRRYPLGRVAAQVMGAVDIDDHGVAGVERFFDHRLNSDPHPLRLSLDVRVQAVVRDELAAAKEEFRAIGACAIVMDVRSGEVIAMVSLPDYDANLFAQASDDQRFNRAVTGMYEPGSTFKLQTAAMALQDGVARIGDRFSTIPIHVGRFTISDMKTDHFASMLSLPAVMAYSSNPAAARIAMDVGAKRQQDWLRAMGFFSKVPVELPEAGHPIVPALRAWGESTVMTVGFGHGIAEPPLAIVRGTAAAANGGVLVKPTLLARDMRQDQTVAGLASSVLAPRIGGMVEEASLLPAGDEFEATGQAQIVPDGPKLISDRNSLLLRKLLRLVVTRGIGSNADVPGYFVGGKTGTAEKIGAHGAYLKHVNVAAFTGIFPMNQPRYAVYVMLDSPVGNKATHGWTTAGWVAAPAVARIVSRVGPMLGLFPETDQIAALDGALALPLEPATGGQAVVALAKSPPPAPDSRTASPADGAKAGRKTAVRTASGRGEAAGRAPAPVRRDVSYHPWPQPEARTADGGARNPAIQADDLLSPTEPRDASR